ncbi:MAG: PAS domain S-box protein [Pseudomonadota bacterium]
MSEPVVDDGAAGGGPPAPRRDQAWRRILFEHAPDAVFALDGEGRVLEANEAFAGLLGRSVPEAMALRLWDWDLDFPEPRAREVLGRDAPDFATFESRWQRADGQLRLVETRIHRLQDATGRLIVASSRDVTERRQHEQALRTTEQRLNRVLATAGMGAWDWDIRARCFTASPEVWALLGRAQCPANGQLLQAAQVLQAMHPDDHARLTEAARRSLQGKLPLAVECRYLRPDGQMLWLSATGVLQHDDAGQPLRVVGALQDITQRRQAEAALRASEERLALALQASRMGVWDWDTDSNDINFSREIFQILGLQPPGPEGGLLPLPVFADHVPPADLQRLEQAIQAALDGGGEFALEIQLIDRQGRRHWLEDRGRVIADVQGRPPRLVGTVHDITEQREAQMLLARELLRRRELIEQSRDGMLVLDDSGRVLEANPAMAAMLGRPLATLPGLCASDLGVALPEASTLAGLAGAAGMRISFDASVPQAQGPALQLEVSASAVLADGNRLVFATCRDVTLRKQAEAALRESERRLGVALMASDMGVWEWDLQTDRLRLSAFSATRLGRDAQRSDDAVLDAAQVLAWVHRDDHAGVLAARHEALHGSGLFQGEYRIFGFDGKLRWIRKRGVLERGPDGRPLRIVGALLEVSEQHRIQQQLHDDANRRRVMIEQSRDGVVVLNTDGSVDEANQAFAQMLGYSLQQVLQLHVWDWDAERSRSQVLRMLAFTGQSSGTLQARMRRQDGRLISVEVSTTGLALGGRQVFFCVCRDVTERLAIETALRESEARHRATFDNSAVGMAERALDGSWRNVNPRLCQITGYDRQALMALHPSLLTHPDDRLDTWPQLRRVMRGEIASTRREKRYLRQDGSTIWVAVSTSAVREADGRARYFVSVIEDITARKRIEAELAGHRQHLEAEVAERTQALEQAMRARIEGEHFLRSIADNIPDMVGYWDARRVLRFANRPYRDWFAPGQDPVGRSRHEFFSDPAHDAGEIAFAAALDGQAQRFEYVLSNTLGEVRYAWVHYIPDRQGEQVAGVFVLVSDISEVKQAELRLQALNEQLVAARDRAEAANRAKSAFLANISHEIRTPMNAIIGLTHLMQRDAGAGQGAERLGKVSEAAHHLLDVINDVLDLSKIESGKLRLEQTDFPIDAVLSRACALVAERARAKGLELVLKSEGVPSLLRGDPTRVSQALLNLMSNAVKFTDRGSVVLRCELMGADADALRLRFSVRDTGVGVPADKIDALFNAFEQADTSTTRRFGGTGLGLAITRRLALLMGGDVGVHTVQGQGSCFWFTANFERATQPALADSARLPGRRALVADDLPEARAALADMLRRLGMQVDSVAGGDEAVQATLLAEQRRRPYELLLLDADMPGTDGLAALRQLRARLGEDSMPPCLLIVDEARATLVAQGPGDDEPVELLGKPVTLSALSAGIDRLDRQPWRRPVQDRTEAQPHERALRQRASGQRVLLAEDNLVNQEVASELLQAVGIQVDLAADGHQAVALAAQHAYDLVLMDMQMPVMDGLAATRALRAMPRHARTPILAMTANAFGDDRRACLAAGMDDHIAKPVDPELLYAMLGRWLPARLEDDAPPVPATALPPAASAQPPAQAPAEASPAPAAAAPPAAAPAAAVRAPAAPTPDFSGIPGLTMARALLYLPGRDEVFARVLRQFSDNYGQGVPGLDAALQAGQWVDAQRLLHSLRGACGAVGATGVQAEALALEQALQALAEQAPPLAAAAAAPSSAALQACLQALVDAVRERLALAAAAAAVPPPPAARSLQLADGLGRLVGLLRVADFQAGAAFRTLEPMLRDVLGAGAAQRLAQPLRQHDYEAALQVAEALLASLAPAPAAAVQ